MKLPLKYYNDPILREKCKKVDKITEEIKKLVSDMIETMDANNGIGLAANQVGYLFKLFVIRPEIKDANGEYALGSPEVYINPVLSKNPSEEKNVMTEGCLSFPGLHIEIERPKKIHVEAIDINGDPVSIDLVGFKAREIMHENDHLNGRLFIDRASKEIRKHIEPALREIKKKYSSLKS